ncbi:MAG: ornithine carbamoyltransferase [Chloroflexota bacterium]
MVYYTPKGASTVKDKHLLSIADLTADEARRVLVTAARLKKEWQQGKRTSPLADKSLAMLFEKPSLRTRVSFEMGMRQLGGHALYLSPDEVQMGRRESVADVARVLSRFVDGIMARVFSHGTLEGLAANSRVPIINGLSDLEHPCQALADLLTVQEKKGDLRGLTLAFVGDADNNVAHSLLLLTTKLGMNFTAASPADFGPSERYLQLARGYADESGSTIALHKDPARAVTGADVVYTDVWTSMGQEAESEQRRGVFAPYQVNKALVDLAKPNAIVMHDLPAHRGEEITDEVIDGPRSVVFDQAENRLHAQKAVLFLILGADKT